MKATVHSADKKQIVEFELPAHTPLTPRVIINDGLNIAYELKATGNTYEYHAVPHLRVRPPEAPVMYDAEGKIA